MVQDTEAIISSQTPQKIILPSELIGQPLFDPQGREWRIHEQESKRFRFLSQKTLVASESETSSGEALDAILRKVAKEVLHSWMEEDARPALGQLTEDIDPFLQKCIMEGERTFRREFITVLGTQGAGVWKKILTDQFEEIGRLFAKEQEGREGVSYASSGLLPPGTRFTWQAKIPGVTYDMFCIESPPQRRTIRIFGEMRRLAFPWMCFLVLFRNGALYTPSKWEGHRNGFWAFYRPCALKSKEDYITIPNMINIDGKWPYWWCLGTGLPSIVLENPNWHIRLFDWFWDSVFGNTYLTAFWEDARQRISQVATVKKWEQLSDKNPEKMLTLPWWKVKQPLGGFAQSVLDHFSSGTQKKGEELEKQLMKERSSAQSLLITRFRERLEEEFHFLGARFTVSDELRETIHNAVVRQLAATGRKSLETLEERAKGIVHRAAENIAERAT